MGRTALLSNVWKDFGGIPDFPDAMCKGSKKPLWDFQLHEDEKTIARTRRHDKAIRICRTCPEQQACFAWGVQNEMYGVWGGAVLVPNGRAYLRCRHCGRGMIKSRYQKPPRGLRNKYSNDTCTICGPKLISA